MAPLRQRMTLFFLYSICSANIVKQIQPSSYKNLYFNFLQLRPTKT